MRALLAEIRSGTFTRGKTQGGVVGRSLHVKDEQFSSYVPSTALIV
jgi:hypothetical protein